MIEKQLVSEQLIIKSLNTDYGIEIIAFKSLPIGADMNAAIYKAQSIDHKSYFVKLKRGHHLDICIAILDLLQNSGISQIISPVKTLQNQSIQRLDDYTLIVYPFIEGQDGFSCDLTDNQWFELGKTLKKIHEIDVPMSIQKQLRREDYSPKWREVVRSFYTVFESVSAVDEIALKFLQFVKSKLSTIRSIVDNADKFCQNLLDQSPELVLCHSDIHGGNVLITQNSNIYIVDWDDPIMAPKERDLMFVGGGVANVWNKPQDIKSFYSGYGASEINSTLIAYYRFERIVQDIAVYSQMLLLTDEGGDERSTMYKQFTDMFDTHGVIDIAFETAL
ncbi:MAG: aminoglycoside phosphotransferase family protein [Parachlamydiales bacterium]|nr:aminoglycoside phosphotransferase family protein [Parachlamydiales bacterium]